MYFHKKQPKDLRFPSEENQEKDSNRNYVDFLTRLTLVRNIKSKESCTNKWEREVS